MRRTIRLVAIACRCSPLLAATPPVPAPLTVAVFDFESSPPGPGIDLSQTLAERLSGQPGITLVDRTSIADVLREQQLSLTGLVDSTSALHAGHLVGAKLLVGGRMFRVGQKL